jgi:type II secretory pathway pseudopilin PulG
MFAFDLRSASQPSTTNREAGYTLVALLALMTVLAISLTAAAPILKQQAQRERELEAIRRGEEVAEAIRMFYMQSNKLPTSMDELIEGVSKQGSTKKLQVLRASAARDPLTEEGEWRLIRPTASNATWCNFVAALREYNDGAPVEANEIFMKSGKLPQCGVTGLLGSGGSGGIDTSDSGTGEFLGVASRSTQTSVVAYYGIEKHNEWIFTPAYPKQ